MNGGGIPWGMPKPALASELVPPIKHGELRGYRGLLTIRTNAGGTQSRR